MEGQMEEELFGELYVSLLHSKIYYNEGVKYKNESKLEIAIEYYENALSILLD